MQKNVGTRSPLSTIINRGIGTAMATMAAAVPHFLTKASHVHELDCIYYIHTYTYERFSACVVRMEMCEPSLVLEPARLG